MTRGIGMKNVFSGKNRIFFLLGFGLLLLGLAVGIWLGAGQKARNVQQFQEKLLLQSWEMDSRIHQLLMPYTAQMEQGTGGFPMELDTQGSLSDQDGRQYQLPPQAQWNPGMNVLPCLGENGEVYLAVVRVSSEGEAKGILLELISFYRDCVPADESYQAVLMDRSGSALIHPRDGGIAVELARKQEYDPVWDALENQEESRSATMGEDSWMGVIPAELSGNGYFTIGILGSVPEGMLWVPGAMGLLCCMLLAAGCALIAAAILKTEQGRRDLELLQQKNAAMEALNQKTQQLAHHQRLEIMGTLTSSIAHEFNNLLVPIMGYSMLALEKLPPENEDIYDDVLEIYNTSLKAKTLIQRLSDLSRKNSETVFRPLSPDELVQKALHVAKPAQSKTITVQTELHCPEACILGNEIQLSQLLLNLILNGFHAMPKGGTLTISTQAQEETVQITVNDTGTGIAPEVISRIFEPFFTTKEQGKGTGLGLAIAAQVVEDHKGEIDVSSRLGVGTTFVVTIPRKQREEPESMENL